MVSTWSPTGASPDRLTFHAGPAAAIDGVAFVQESAPEKLDVKRALYADIDAALPDDVVMASSTSGLNHVGAAGGILQGRTLRGGTIRSIRRTSFLSSRW